MNRVYLKLSVILASGIFASGLIWLLVYSLNFRKGIGFDGPAGGLLGPTLLGGWVISAVATWIWYKRKSLHRVVVPTILLVVVGGLAVLGTGYVISLYALHHYPDNAYSSME